MKIIIWGIGEIEKEFIQYLKQNVEVVGIIDTYRKCDVINGITVYYPDEVLNRDIKYDFIIIASVYSNEILDIIRNYNIEMNKLIFLRPFQVMGEVDMYLRNLSSLEDIAPGYMKVAKRESGFRMGIDSVINPVCNTYPLYQWDYFRYRTFELVADQIKDIKGAVAEAGVFKGFFSKVINSKFPDDTFYLFDTFEGFIDEEAQNEKDRGHCDQGFIDIFKDTSVESVLDRMPHKEKCVICKGFFPETAQRIKEDFKFVSIDFDFEESIYAALEWFYPKLVEGGYIFLHDYNEPTLVGVKNAVIRYEQKYGKLIKIPIADKCGTLIIYKG